MRVNFSFGVMLMGNRCVPYFLLYASRHCWGYTSFFLLIQSTEDSSMWLYSAFSRDQRWLTQASQDSRILAALMIVWFSLVGCSGYTAELQTILFILWGLLTHFCPYEHDCCISILMCNSLAKPLSAHECATLYLVPENVVLKQNACGGNAGRISLLLFSHNVRCMF